MSIYKNYSFVLEFDELSEELQKQKIDEVITYNFNNNEYKETKQNGYPVELEQLLKDEDIRYDVKASINSRFPMYF